MTQVILRGNEITSVLDSGVRNNNFKLLSNMLLSLRPIKNDKKGRKNNQWNASYWLFLLIADTWRFCLFLTLFLYLAKNLSWILFILFCTVVWWDPFSFLKFWDMVNFEQMKALVLTIPLSIRFFILCLLTCVLLKFRTWWFKTQASSNWEKKNILEQFSKVF